MDEREKQRDASGREGFGDDGGTRVGRPDAGRTDERSMARLSENADDRGIEGAVLDESQASRAERRADGSAMSGREHAGTSGGGADTLDHAQRAQSGTPERGTGMGAEGAQGVHHAQSTRGTSQESVERSDRAGSEPLAGRGREHKPSYGGEGGEPRTSSDQRENPNDPKIK